MAPSTSTLRPLSTLLYLALVLGVGFVAYGQHKLGERLDALEEDRSLAAVDALPEGVSNGGPTTQGAPALQGNLGHQVHRIETLVEGLTSRVAEAERALAEAPKAASGEGASQPIAAVVEDPLFERAVEDVALALADDVRFRAKLGLRGSPSLPKKPAFHQLAGALDLDADQEEKLRGDLMGMKEEAFALLSEERDDGIVPMEEIQKAEALPEHDPERAQIFMSLFTKKIPGSDETYMQRLVTLTGELRKRVGGYLSNQQRDVWNALDVDLLGVEME